VMDLQRFVRHESVATVAARGARDSGHAGGRVLL